MIYNHIIPYLWNNVVIIHNTVQTGNSPFKFFCLSDIYLTMADLDSRNMLQCIIKDYCTRSICCV